MKAEATMQRSGSIGNTTAIVLAILATVVVWAFSPFSLSTVALLAVAIIFLFGLKQPVWAMAALLVSQLTVTSYMVATPFGFSISLRLLLLVLTFIIILPHLFVRGQTELGTKAKPVLIPAIVLTVISVVANIVNVGFNLAFADFRNMLVGLLIIILLPLVTKNLKDLKILCAVAFAGMVASATIGVMQHFNILGMQQQFLDPKYTDILRVPGMAESELELSFTLPIAVLAVLGIFLANGIKNSTKTLMVLSLPVLGLALYFTYTRSALLALLLGLVAFVIFFKTRTRSEIILASSIVAVGLISVFGILEGQYLGGRQEVEQEGSTISRQIVWQAGMGIVADYPILGIGADQFKTVSLRYASKVDPDLLEWEKEHYWSYQSLGNIAPHNDFLMMWVSYGTLALAGYLWLLFAVLGNFLYSYRASKVRFIRGLSVGLAAGIIVYGANAFYHNVLSTLPLFWILAGLSVTTAKLASLESASKPRLGT
jgi:O-antigen ligase